MAEASRKAIRRLAREAEQLRRLSELQSLKQNPVEPSVNGHDLFEMVRREEAASQDRF